MFDNNFDRRRRHRSKVITQLILLVLVLSAVLYLVAGEGRNLWDDGIPPQGTAPVNVSQNAGDPLVTLIPSDFGQIVRDVKPAVVRLVVKRVQYWYLQPISSEGMGTGFIVDPAGYVLTNRHVTEDARSVEVFMADGSQHAADIVAVSATSDLALLKMSGAANLPYVTFLTEGNPITPYQWVIAMGYPFNIGGDPTVSEGIISAVGRAVQLEDGTILNNLLQTTAATNPGNSGGPLLNLSGEVVGINTAVIKGAENIGFAISRDTILEFIHSLQP